MYGGRHVQGGLIDATHVLEQGSARVVADGSLHPSKVVWLRHHARTGFTLDGGPRPDLAHAVTPGIDLEFIPNWFVPYQPFTTT